MTRKEIIELLRVIRAAYPNTKITDAAGMVNAWELAFAEYDASVIYKAARHHMNTNKWFPTVPDIRKAISKGQMLYGEDQPTQNSGNLVANTPVAPKVSILALEQDESFCKVCGLCNGKSGDYYCRDI